MLSVTSDVQSVNATVVRESTIDIQCLFIHGSDAVGCKVVLVSYQQNVNNETATLLRKNSSAFAQLNLMNDIVCYDQVLAYTIDAHNITTSFFIQKRFTFETGTVCSGK